MKHGALNTTGDGTGARARGHLRPGLLQRSPSPPYLWRGARNRLCRADKGRRGGRCCLHLVGLFLVDGPAHLSVGFDGWASQYVEISGDAGLLRIGKAWNNENQDVTLEHHTAAGVEVIEFPPTHQFTHQLEHLCDCLESGQDHRISPQNSIEQMRVLDAIAESMQTGAAVRL